MTTIVDFKKFIENMDGTALVELAEIEGTRIAVMVDDDYVDLVFGAELEHGFRLDMHDKDLDLIRGGNFVKTVMDLSDLFKTEKRADVWYVPSLSEDGKEYTVTLLSDGSHSCSCPDWRYRRNGLDGLDGRCKHIQAVHARPDLYRD